MSLSERFRANFFEAAALAEEVAADARQQVVALARGWLGGQRVYVFQTRSRTERHRDRDCAMSSTTGGRATCASTLIERRNPQPVCFSRCTR
jgi:hypothetical protein